VFISYGKHAAYSRLFTFGFISGEDRVGVPLGVIKSYMAYYAETLMPDSVTRGLWTRYDGACAGGQSFEWSEGPLDERTRSCLIMYALSALKHQPDTVVLSHDDPMLARMTISDPASGLMGAIAWYALNTVAAMQRIINKHGDKDIKTVQARIDRLPANAHPALPFLLRGRQLELMAYTELADRIYEAFGVTQIDVSAERAREHLADLRPAPLLFFAQNGLSQPSRHAQSFP
jgi:hypothetical protein